MRKLEAAGIAAMLGAALLWTGCLFEAGENPAAPSRPESRAELGREWFEGYCASCHGLSARGDGPVAASLSRAPADLTRIATRNQGRFDAARVATFIDGRERVAAHGPADMPVWGRRFDDRLEQGFADETRLSPGAIFLIVEYLKAIQASP